MRTVTFNGAEGWSGLATTDRTIMDVNESITHPRFRSSFSAPVSVPDIEPGRSAGAAFEPGDAGSLLLSVPFMEIQAYRPPAVSESSRKDARTSPPALRPAADGIGIDWVH